MTRCRAGRRGHDLRRAGMTRGADLVGVSTRRATRKRYAHEGRESTPKHKMLWSGPAPDPYMLRMWTRSWVTGRSTVGDRCGRCGRTRSGCGSAVCERRVLLLLAGVDPASFAHPFLSVPPVGAWQLRQMCSLGTAGGLRRARTRRLAIGGPSLSPVRAQHRPPIPAQTLGIVPTERISEDRLRRTFRRRSFGELEGAAAPCPSDKPVVKRASDTRRRG
jgi:hypothetical protein